MPVRKDDSGVTESTFGSHAVTPSNRRSIAAKIEGTLVNRRIEFHSATAFGLPDEEPDEGFSGVGVITEEVPYPGGMLVNVTRDDGKPLTADMEDVTLL